MENLKTIIKSLIFTLFFTLFHTTVYGAAGDSCTNAVDIRENSDINVRTEHDAEWLENPLKYYYYKFTAPSDGSIIISMTNPSSGMYLALLEGCWVGVIGAQWGNSTFTVGPHNVTAGTTYYIYIDSRGTHVQTAVLRVNFTQGSGGGNNDDNLSPSLTKFSLINPPNTRNIIGNYKIAGNTVLCLTQKRTGYGGECTDNAWVTSNMRVSKYLDIDNDPGTWNSTSSYVNLDEPYDPARGIVWAGLFWSGRISFDNDHPIRYAVENGPNSFSTIEIGARGGENINTIDVKKVGAENIKLKIDTGAYADILASNIHVRSHDGGETYAAFADVSAQLKSANLGLGKHIFTVANLTSMEGREPAPGAFGGWSLVIIYSEDYTNGRPRNISIYNGFVNIGTGNDPIEIAGFKLPTEGDVMAQLSVFSGEGEFRYGRNTRNNNSDWMKISNALGSGFDYLPGKTEGTHLGNRDNMFDAQLDNILRDNIAGKFNDLSSNNVGVDVDTYDVSQLMTNYRNDDQNISSVFIQVYSDGDYIISSMIAFSAELYVPELCYDYTLDIDGHVIDSVDNEIQTPFGGFGKDLTTVIFLKSLEGDIPLINTGINYGILDTSQLKYDYANCSTEISETGEYDYTDACPYVHTATSSGFSMHIGTGKTSTSGGEISNNETRFIRFDTKFQTPNVSTAFTFSVDYTVDYGSGIVPLTKEFSAADLCEPVRIGFFPLMGSFNVVDNSNTIDQWNLYTQTANRGFNLRVFAHDAINPILAIERDLNLSVEVEMIRADNFNRDANTACNDEHSYLEDVPRKFVHFSDTRSTELSYAAAEINLAYRSIAMRVWYLTDIFGGGVLTEKHNCTRLNQNACIELYNRDYDINHVGGGQCANECRVALSSGNCYDCLRTLYGRKVCSRDNFAIRPEAFMTQIRDSNQSTNIDMPNIQIADSIVGDTVFSVIAGYDYRFDINATNHMNNIATPRYIQAFEPGSNTHRVSMQWAPNRNTSGCNDVEDKNISLNIMNGSTINLAARTSHVDGVDQIGRYRFSVFDQNWTSVDWNPAQRTHHTAYANYYIQRNDCVVNNNTVFAEEYPTTPAKARPGCLTSSIHTHASGTQYRPLFPQFYPYTFDVSGLNMRVGPNDNSNLVYINTLDSNLYPNGVDEDMSYNIQGTFFAAGHDDMRTSNFVENCYAESVNMSLYQFYNHPAPANTEFLTYDLINYKTTNPSDIIRTREQDDFTQYNVGMANPMQPLTIAQGARFFRQDMNASITMDLGYNFARTNNLALNPRRITMRDFNVTYSVQPPEIFVDLIRNYRIFGNRDIDQDVTFAYGRARPSKIFYDDITTGSVITPISVVVYCDLGINNCQDRGLALMDAQTNESSWWKSTSHNSTNGDGNIVLSIPAQGSFANTTQGTVSANITSNGTNNAISVFNLSGNTPVTYPIDFVLFNLATPAAPYTDRWLIYNLYDALLAPSPFYRVRFIGNSIWTGRGMTGNIVGTEAASRKTKRLDW